MLMIAIVIIVVFSLLAAVLVKLQGLSSQSSIYQVTNQRALLAAESGIQYGLYQLLRNNSGCESGVDKIDGFNLNLSGEGPGLGSCSVELSCEALYPKTGTPNYMQLTSKAECGRGFQDSDDNPLVTRELEVELRR